MRGKAQIIAHSALNVAPQQVVVKRNLLTSGERAKNARIQYQFGFITATLFGCYGNVPLQVGKQGTDSSSLHTKRFHMVKDCENRSSRSGDIRRNTPNHDVNTQRNFDYAVLRRNYWTDLHQNFTRYSGISDAIQSCIYSFIHYSFIKHGMSERRPHTT